MSDIRFYHLERQSLEQVLPSLLKKALSNGHRILVKTPDEREAERLAQHLWSFDQDSFIPHGTKKDGNAQAQPVWLSANDDNPNEADVLILVGGAQSDQVASFKLCCEMLDGRNPEAVSAGRTRWKAYDEAGHDLTYWQQSAQGGWEKKA